MDAELAYVSGGFNWTADYNMVDGDSNALDIIGWVTMENRSGKEFENARVKLMAGDVNKISRRRMRYRVGGESYGRCHGRNHERPLQLMRRPSTSTTSTPCSAR